MQEEPERGEGRQGPVAFSSGLCWSRHGNGRAAQTRVTVQGQRHLITLPRPFLAFLFPSSVHASCFSFPSLPFNLLNPSMSFLSVAVMQVQLQQDADSHFFNVYFSDHTMCAFIAVQLMGCTGLGKTGVPNTQAPHTLGLQVRPQCH